MKILAVLLLLTLTLTGCQTLGIGQPNSGERWLADLGCLTALAGAGITVAGDPMVNGASTALDVLTAIVHVGSGSVPAEIIGACAQTLSWVAQDAQDAFNISKAQANAAPEVKAQLKLKAARKAPKPAAPPVPIKVIIPLP